VFCGRHLLAAKLRRSNIDGAAAAVWTHSARIGDALSTFNHGVISAANAIAQREGV
jgi:hypothetical protein